MAKVSVAIMGHPARERFIAELQEQLPEAELALDRVGDRWETGRRALLAADPEATHHLVVQDDAILCRDFVAGAELALEAAGERPVAFYTGKPRPIAGRVRVAVRRARRDGRSWIAMEGPLWGVAVAVPVGHVRPLVDWADKHPEVANYDDRIARYFDRKQIRCWYTVPSLADHRPVAENPSLVNGRSADRRAHWFIGDRSPLEIDWTRLPAGTLNSRPRRKPSMAQKRIADRRIYGRNPAGREVLVAAKGQPIPDWYIEGGGPETPEAPQGARKTYTKSPTTDAPPEVELSALKRPALNARARTAGVSDPESLPNKQAVIDAIKAQG